MATTREGRIATTREEGIAWKEGIATKREEGILTVNENNCDHERNELKLYKGKELQLDKRENNYERKKIVNSLRRKEIAAY